MKVSDLIAKLGEYLRRYGDHEIMFYNEYIDKNLQVDDSGGQSIWHCNVEDEHIALVVIEIIPIEEPEPEPENIKDVELEGLQAVGLDGK